MSKRLLSVLAFALVISLGASILIYRLVCVATGRQRQAGNHAGPGSGAQPACWHVD